MGSTVSTKTGKQISFLVEWYVANCSKKADILTTDFVSCIISGLNDNPFDFAN